jgi:hypothetical protein
MGTLQKPALKTNPEPLTLERERMRLVVFGEYGVGKTTLALTAPKPLVIDTNGGLISVTVKPGAHGDAWTPEDHVDLESLVFWLLKNRDLYETFVIDSGDSLVNLLMAEITYDAAQRKENPMLRMTYVPEQGDYFASQRQMSSFLSDLRKLKKHVVVTFGAREMDKPPFKRTMDVSPGMRKIFMDWASVVGELVVITKGESAGQRALVTAPGGKTETKSRFSSLVPVVADPTFGKLWGSVEAEYEAAKEVK